MIERGAEAAQQLALHRRHLEQGKIGMGSAAEAPTDQRSQYTGNYVSEEDAARAYHRAAVHANGPDAKHTPGEAIRELPVSLGEANSEMPATVGIEWHEER
jgi:hypothetical protein